MKVFVKPQEGLSRAMDRVARGLTEDQAVTVVDHEEDADFVLIHAIGFPETVAAVNRCHARGQLVGIAQYCLRTTQKPNTKDWLPVWQKAGLVWSYYDIPALCEEDGVKAEGFVFYHSPLGCEPAIFYPSNNGKTYKIATSGYVAATECVMEANIAVTKLRKRQFHLGPDNLGLTRAADCRLNIPDAELASLLGQCEFVAGLRRVEGFELPAVEGLFCGARPIVFDRPHYRHWFGELAEYIPEREPHAVVADLMDVLSKPARPVTAAERQQATRLFSWPAVAAGLWSAVSAMPKADRLSRPIKASRRPRLLYVGDAAVASGFARAAHRGILADVHKTFDVTCLGINYIGDPHTFPYRIYPCHDYFGGDAFGTYRMPKLVQKIKPELAIIQQDPWNFPPYFHSMEKSEVSVPVIGAVAVDALNCRGKCLNNLVTASFWTEFGRAEAEKGGYEGPSQVIPLGVDLDIYHPMDRHDARVMLGIPKDYCEVFIVGNVNRNQPRKRLDLTIANFAEWVKAYGIKDAYLYLHVAPTGDRGYDVKQLMAYYGVLDRLILAEPELGQGMSEKMLSATYAAFDVQVSTTQGEGWGLTTMEGMACGVPQIVPKWSALGEWAAPAARLVPCIRENIVTDSNINTIGGVASSLAFVEALHETYSDESLRNDMRTRGLELVARSEYRWESIAARWLSLVSETYESLQTKALKVAV